MRMYTQDTVQQALGFLVSQTTYIEPQVVRIKYPELDYASLVPIDTSAPPWVKSVTFFSADVVGKAEWFHHLAKDIPIADVSRNKFESGIEMAAIGYRYSLEEIQQAMMIPNWNLTTERAAAARRAYETFMYYVALWGDTRKGWTGLFNSPDVPIINATHTWPYWIAQGAAYIPNIMQDVNALLTNIWTSTLTIEMADTILLPLSSQQLLSMTQLPNTTMNLVEWISKNNQYTQETGRPLMIRGKRGLDTAGASGTGRIVAYRRDPDVVKMHVPMPHQFMPVFQSAPIVFDVPGIFRTGGVEIRRPGAFRYLDGV